MTSLTDGLSKFIQTSGGITQLSTVVQTLRDMMKKAPTNEAEDVKSDLLDVCQTVVPDHLIQLLLDQMSDAKVCMCVCSHYVYMCLLMCKYVGGCYVQVCLFLCVCVYIIYGMSVFV